MKSNRRKFVRIMMAIGAGLGLVPLQKISARETGEKVKMLAPDGTLVEIDKSVLDQVSKTRASNKEVQEWMQTGKGLDKL